MREVILGAVQIEIVKFSVDIHGYADRRIAVGKVQGVVSTGISNGIGFIKIAVWWRRQVEEVEEIDGVGGIEDAEDRVLLEFVEDLEVSFLREKDKAQTRRIRSTE